MESLLDKIKKTLEETYDVVRGSASTMIDRAEDFGKISKIKFEIRQLSLNVEKKLTILGDAVLPHLIKNDVESLKNNPAIKLVVEEIQDINNQIDNKQKDMDKVVAENEQVVKLKEQEKLGVKIKELEKEIEQRMDELNNLRSQNKK